MGWGGTRARELSGRMAHATLPPWDQQQGAAQRQVNLPSSEHFQVRSSACGFIHVAPLPLYFILFHQKKTHKYNALA